MSEGLQTGPPVVTLRSASARPYDGAIAAARTCYSPRVIGAEEVTPGQRESIGPLTFEAGHHEMTVGEISKAIKSTDANISQHLSILRDKGILAARKDANKVYYRVSDPKILQLIGSLREAFCSAVRR